MLLFGQVLGCKRKECLRIICEGRLGREQHEVDPAPQGRLLELVVEGGVLLSDRLPGPVQDGPSVLEPQLNRSQLGRWPGQNRELGARCLCQAAPEQEGSQRYDCQISFRHGPSQHVAIKPASDGDVFRGWEFTPTSRLELEDVHGASAHGQP